MASREKSSTSHAPKAVSKLQTKVKIKNPSQRKDAPPKPKTQASKAASQSVTQNTQVAKAKAPPSKPKPVASNEKSAIPEVVDPPYRIIFSKRVPKRKRDEETPDNEDDSNAKSSKRLKLDKNAFDRRLDVMYKVEAKSEQGTMSKPWNQLTKRLSFQIEGEKVSTGEIVLVRNPDSTLDDVEDENGSSDRYWVAQILEIRYLDNFHVYCRIRWLYRPEETVGGRKSYHASGEVLASNHMDIIDAVTVDSHTDLTKVDEKAVHTDEDPTRGYTDHMWRYSYDALKQRRLDDPFLICKCRRPIQPDWGPVRCNGPKGCQRLMHRSCIEDDVCERMYKRNIRHEQADRTDTRAASAPASIKKIVFGAFGKSKSKSSPPPNSVPAAEEHHDDDVDLLDDAKLHYDAELVCPPQGTKYSAPLTTTVTTKYVENDTIAAVDFVPKVTQEPVLCLFCSQQVLQQRDHALLDPKIRAEIDADGAIDGESTADGHDANEEDELGAGGDA